MPGIQYHAFTDPSGRSADSMTLCIGHEQDGRVVVDAVREQKPPFSPENTVSEFAGVLKSYGVSIGHGDRYGGLWPQEQWRKHGIDYQVAEQ